MWSFINISFKFRFKTGDNSRSISTKNKNFNKTDSLQDILQRLKNQIDLN